MSAFPPIASCATVSALRLFAIRTISRAPAFTTSGWNTREAVSETAWFSCSVIEIKRLHPLFHKDPADRLIVASCLKLGAPLVTLDRRIRDWGYIQTVS